MGRAKTEVTENQRRSILSRYQKGEGFNPIGEALNLSFGVIRRVLVENNVEIRGRGRPCKATA